MQSGFNGGNIGNCNGGGATDIRRPAFNPNAASCAFDMTCAFTQRIVVAGAGGGSGQMAVNSVCADGGDAGYPIGFSGTAANRAVGSYTGNATPGRGATHAGGGAAGTGTMNGGYGPPYGGSLGVGGYGAW